MQKELIDKLRHSAEQFYLDMHQDEPMMPDREYDELAAQYEAETGKSVKNLIDWNSVGKLEHIQDLSPLSKIQVKDNDLKAAAKKWIDDNNVSDYYFNLKYDGCGIRIYLKNGKVSKILSTPDEKFGQLKTDTLSCLVPSEFDDPTIESIIGELVVSPKIFGYGSRSKANGLMNSKFKLDDIKKYAMIRVYRVTYTDSKEYDYERQLATLESLPYLWDDEKCYFAPAARFKLDEIPSKSIDDTTGELMQADGVVIYTKQMPKAFKFYFNDSAIAEVGKITYTLQKTNNLFPKLWFKTPVKIESKNIGKCSGGSLAIIKGQHIGVGAKIEVILSNSTIPKVLRVVEPSDDFQIPDELKQYE